MYSWPYLLIFYYLCSPFLHVIHVSFRPNLRLSPRSPTLYSSTTIPSTLPVLPSGARATRLLSDSFVMPKSSMAVCEFFFIYTCIFLSRIQVKLGGLRTHRFSSASMHFACFWFHRLSLSLYLMAALITISRHVSRQQESSRVESNERVEWSHVCTSITHHIHCPFLSIHSQIACIHPSLTTITNETCVE